MINEPSLAEAIMELSLLSCPPSPPLSPPPLSPPIPPPHPLYQHLQRYSSRLRRHQTLAGNEHLSGGEDTMHYFYTATTNIQCAAVVLNSFLIALLCIGEGWRGEITQQLSQMLITIVSYMAWSCVQLIMTYSKFI